MPPPAPRLAGVIFDFDGTLVDTANTWQLAERQLLRELGSAFSPALAHTYQGLGVADVGRAIYRHCRPPDHGPEDCARRLRELLLAGGRRAVPQPLPGADELLARTPLPLAVASGSPRELLEQVLDALGWRARFRVLVSSEEVPRGKPHPDVFLEAARRLALAPAALVAVEDSWAGVQAAKAAGMTCYAVPSTTEPRLLAAADRVFRSLAAIEFPGAGPARRPRG